MNQKSKTEKFVVNLEIFSSQDIDEVDVEDMLSNVVTGMIRQYDLDKVVLKRRNTVEMELTA